MTRRSLATAIGLASGTAALALSVLPAWSEEFSSAYTPLDLDKCKMLSAGGDEADGGTWLCEGYDGIDVRVAEGDLRFFVTFGPGSDDLRNAENQTAANETLPQFNTIGDTLEWRLAMEDGKPTPFATILRYNWKVDGKSGATLVVTKLAKDNACHLAYIVASGNPQANEQARAIADRDAAEFVCEQDSAKHYDATGKEAMP